MKTLLPILATSLLVSGGCTTESLRPLANNPPATPNLACHRRQRPPSGNTENDPGTHYLAV